MMKLIFSACTSVLLFSSCQKSVHEVRQEPIALPIQTEASFVQYTIEQGQQFSNNTGFKGVEHDELKFDVKFDSSAIYHTTDPANQADINKLYGFSDNRAQHHQYSARFGWNWGKQGLTLYGYIYNDGVRSSKAMGTVAIGAINRCSIKVTATSYIFSLNDKTETMPRTSTTTKGIGYQLYPYFGGDEFAPHKINIWIKEL
jgi:hypothetical protein